MVRRHVHCHRLFGVGATLKTEWHFDYNPERRKRIHVFASRMGATHMAAFCTEIRQAVDFSGIYSWSDSEFELSLVLTDQILTLFRVPQSGRKSY